MFCVFAVYQPPVFVDSFGYASSRLARPCLGRAVWSGRVTASPGFFRFSAQSADLQAD